MSLPVNSTGPLCEASEDDPTYCAYHRERHAVSDDDEVTITVTIRARVKSGYGAHEVADVVRFHCGVSSLDSLEADVSAVHVYDVREAHRPILPGDLVEKPANPELDPREVLSVGLDWLTLDLLGRESPRLPLDNYRTLVPADGVL